MRKRARLAHYGPNELGDDDGPDGLTTLLNQVLHPLVVVLIVAGLVTALLGEYADATAIGAIVVLKTAVGFVQERQAERSVRALLLPISPRARVVRNNEDWEVESRDLVPGDIVLLESGARVPADLRPLRVESDRLDAWGSGPRSSPPPS
jgi:Ca2+-transporting ATPase